MTKTQKRNIFKCLSEGSETKGHPSVQENTWKRKANCESVFHAMRMCHAQDLQSWFPGLNGWDMRFKTHTWWAVRTMILSIRQDSQRTTLYLEWAGNKQISLLAKEANRKALGLTRRKEGEEQENPTLFPQPSLRVGIPFFTQIRDLSANTRMDWETNGTHASRLLASHDLERGHLSDGTALWLRPPRISTDLDQTWIQKHN